MSLESISALRQLTQVREQGATNQNENLEKVQDSVQQISTSEAQRTNDLFLAKVKAEYEVSLSDATVKRIESQLARERTSLFVTGLVTGMTVALAGVDMGMNLYKDFKGGQNLGDPGTGKSNARAIASDKANVDSVGNSFYASSTSDLAKGQSETVFRTTINNKKTVNETGDTIDNGGTANQRLSAADITLGDIQQINPNAKSFNELKISNPQEAEELFNKNERTMRTDEASGAASIFKGEGGGGIEGALIKKSGTNDKAGAKTVAGEINNSINDVVKADREASTTSVKQGAKYIANALISFAQTVVPQFQAYLAAKDKVERTEIELQAAIEKLAAANKKLAQINQIITTVAGDDLGSGNNVDSKT